MSRGWAEWPLVAGRWALVAHATGGQAGAVQTSTLSTILGGTWFGAPLPVAARASLAAVGSVVEIAAGTAILEQDRPCEAMGILVSGKIAIRLRARGIGERTITMLEPGEVFGWSALLPGAAATATCVAVVPSVAILFDGVGLMIALELDDALAAVVYHRLLATVGARLVETRLKLLDVDPAIPSAS
jgi:CRP-like cAMP-binding protein